MKNKKTTDKNEPADESREVSSHEGAPKTEKHSKLDPFWLDADAGVPENSATAKLSVRNLRSRPGDVPTWPFSTSQSLQQLLTNSCTRDSTHHDIKVTIAELKDLRGSLEAFLHQPELLKTVPEKGTQLNQRTIPQTNVIELSDGHSLEIKAPSSENLALAADSRKQLEGFQWWPVVTRFGEKQSVSDMALRAWIAIEVAGSCKSIDAEVKRLRELLLAPPPARSSDLERILVNAIFEGRFVQLARYLTINDYVKGTTNDFLAHFSFNKCVLRDNAPAPTDPFEPVTAVSRIPAAETRISGPIQLTEDFPDKVLAVFLGFLTEKKTRKELKILKRTNETKLLEHFVSSTGHAPKLKSIRSMRSLAKQERSSTNKPEWTHYCRHPVFDEFFVEVFPEPDYR